MDGLRCYCVLCISKKKQEKKLVMSELCGFVRFVVVIHLFDRIQKTSKIRFMWLGYVRIM